jgi:hypothetical protein
VPSQVYKMDETGLTTVQGGGKGIAPKGQKQVGQITPAERGNLITMCCAMNSIGNTIPPLLIFPRKYFKDHMLKGAPLGSIDSATPSGCITAEIFANKWMGHFIRRSKPTPCSVNHG